MYVSTKTLKSQFGLCAWILQVLVVWVLIYLLVCLGIHPKTPNFNITNFYFPALDLNNNTSSHGRNNTTDLLSITTFNLQISNPNKGIPVYYNDINISLHYNNWVVGESCVKGFKQGHKKSTERAVRLKYNSSNGYAELMREWRAFLSSGVSLRVGVMGEIRYRILWWKSRRHLLDLEAMVPVGSDGKVLGGMNYTKLNEL